MSPASRCTMPPRKATSTGCLSCSIAQVLTSTKQTQVCEQARSSALVWSWRFALSLHFALSFCPADGWSPLQEAAARHYEDVCKALVDAGANLDHQNNGVRISLLSLSCAARSTAVAVATHCAEVVADVSFDSSFTPDGWTPLHEAAARGLMDTTRLLVEHGANLEMKNKGRSAAFASRRTAVRVR